MDKNLWYGFRKTICNNIRRKDFRSRRRQIGKNKEKHIKN